jgi:hypothetical protein
MGKFVHIDQYDGSMKLSKLKQLVNLERFLLNYIVNYQRYTASMVNGKPVEWY